ncbi:MAG: zf-HC2 domain-containing protein [Micromonosporaceae bacterium]|nr:zf-HC2 domain-containing protein [Micromonosporaceae bacterium]
MRCMHSIEAGAYVLGALAPADRSAYQRHLTGCAVCREEVADLAGLPGLLSRLDEPTAAAIAEGQAPGEALRVAVVTEQPEPADLIDPGLDDTVPISGMPIGAGPASGTPVSPGPYARRPSARPPGRPVPAPPPSLLPGVLETTRARRALARRRGRWLTAGGLVLAVCLVMVSFVSGLAVHRQNGQPVAGSTSGVPQRWLAPMEGARSDVPVTAVIAFEQAADGGTDIAMSCTYTATSDTSEKWQLQMVVYPKSGNAETVSTFWASPNEYKAVTAHSSMAPSDIGRIEVQLVKQGTPVLIYRVT